MFGVYEVAQENTKIIYSHFKKHCYLLTQEDQKNVDDAVEKIDSIEQSIINFQLQLCNSNKNESDEETIISKNIYKNVQERLIKGTEFEELYFNMYKNALNQISYSDSNKMG